MLSFFQCLCNDLIGISICNLENRHHNWVAKQLGQHGQLSPITWGRIASAISPPSQHTLSKHPPDHRPTTPISTAPLPEPAYRTAVRQEEQCRTSLPIGVGWQERLVRGALSNTMTISGKNLRHNLETNMGTIKINDNFFYTKWMPYVGWMDGDKWMMFHNIYMEIKYISSDLFATWFLLILNFLWYKIE